MKPFQPSPSKIVTVTINEDGSQTYLKTDSADIFLELGEVVTRRASHVEPAPFWDRLLFTVLRALFADDSRVAAWTRKWNTLWRVNTAPVGGPILTWRHVYPQIHSDHVMIDHVYCWADRQAAIDAEIEFLNKFFAERKIQ